MTAVDRLRAAAQAVVEAHEWAATAWEDRHSGHLAWEMAHDHAEQTRLYYADALAAAVLALLDGPPCVCECGPEPDCPYCAALAAAAALLPDTEDAT